jgi:hypothetical protein
MFVWGQQSLDRENKIEVGGAPWRAGLEVGGYRQKQKNLPQA